MAGRINDDDIQALRERADIAVVIGDYTALRRAGTKLKGLCPFHDEKTPSFTVDPVRKLFHCFGCQVGGDVYEFLMRIEALTFPEAVERLARLSGFSLRYEELSPGQQKALGRRTRLVQALNAAAVFYRDTLAGADGAAARAYLAQRGVDESGARQFGLGWAPDSWDALVRHLQPQGFAPQELVDAGLAVAGSRGVIDRFRARVMFPIIDKGGRDVLAFGGRLLPGPPPRTAPRDGAPPKYINSPETDLYRKASTLYGLNWARAEIQRRGAALVVEGYMDVIALHLAGAANAVATCGTALTADHLRVLDHFASRVVLALDADTAGFAAADRARALAEEVGIAEVGVLPLPAGQDPADLAAEGSAVVEVALKGTKTAVEFQIEHLLRDDAPATPEGQNDLYRRTFPLLARLDDRALRYRYIRDIVAPAVRLSADLIEQELDADLARRGQAGAATAGAAAPRRPWDVTSAAPPRDPQLLLEREVLRTALQSPEHLPPSWSSVRAEDFRAPMSQQLFRAIVDAPSGDLQAVLAALPDDDVRARVRALALSDTTVEATPSNASELVARLRAAAVAREIDELRQRLARLNERTDGESAREVIGTLSRLERRRRDLLEGRED